MKNYEEYRELINNEYNNFLILLNELEKIYVLQKTSPNYKPYLEEYNQDVDLLRASLDSLMSTKNSINRDLYLLNTEVSSMNEKLSKLEKENQILLETYDDLDTTSGAPGELKQRMYLYNQAFVQNIVLFLALCLFIGLFVKFYPKKTTGSVKESALKIGAFAEAVGAKAVETGRKIATKIEKEIPEIENTIRETTQSLKDTTANLSSDLDTDSKS